jgi:hypothetical protein
MKPGKFYSPTPVKARKIGDAILFATASLSALMMGSPLDDTQIKWVIFSLSVVGVMGKTISNMFKEDGNDSREV